MESPDTRSAVTEYLAVRDALRARKKYEIACERLYDFLLVDFPELEEMLKIGKRGSKVRQEERREREEGGAA